MRRLGFTVLVVVGLGGLARLVVPQRAATGSAVTSLHSRRPWQPVGAGWLSQTAGLLATVDARALHVTALDETMTTVRFRAATVLGGARRLGGAASMSARHDTVDVDRAEYVEQYRARSDGVEVRWAFEAKVAGPLEVRVPIEGASPPTAGRGGLRLGALALGHGTWVDADGRRTPVPVEWNGGAARWVVPEALVAQSRFPAVLDPLIGLERQLDEPVYPGVQGEPATAVSGDRALAVWVEDTGLNTAVKAVLVDLAGADPTVTTRVLRPFPQQGQQTQRRPAVAATTTGWVVVWEENVVNLFDTPDIVAVAVSRAGAIVAGPVALTGPGVQTDPTVAFRGSEGLVAWVDDDNLRLLSLTESLAAGGTAVPLTSGALRKQAPVAAASAQGYFVAWEQDSNDGDVFGLQLDANRAIRGSPIAVAGQLRRQASPTVSALGSDWLVAWVDEGASPRNVLVARVATVDGGVVPRPGSVVASLRDQASPSLTALPSGSALLVYEQNTALTDRDVFAVTIGPGTTPGVDFDVVRFPADQTAPRVSASTAGVFVVWEDGRPSNGRSVFGSVLRFDGGVRFREGIALSSSANTQKAPDVALGDGGALVVWQDDREGAPAVFGAFRASDGGQVGDAFRVWTSSGLPHGEPRVAWNGAFFVVVFETSVAGGKAVAARVLQPDGSAGSPLQLSPALAGDRMPAVAAVGSEVLVTWVEPVLGVPQVMVRAIDPTGQPGAPARPVSRGSGGDRRSPAMASDGTNARLVWVDSLAGATQLRSATVSGALVDLDIDAELTPPTSAVAVEPPALAWTGTDYVLLWNSGGAVVSATLPRRGTPRVTGTVLASGVPQQRVPALAPTRATALAAWEARVDGGSTVRVQRLFADGGAMLGPDTSGRPGALRLPNEQTPRVSCDGTGRCLAVFVVDDPSPHLRTTRVWLTPLTPNSPPMATGFGMSADAGEPTPIDFQVSDPDGELPGIEVTSQPTLGAISAGVFTSSQPGTSVFQYVAVDGFGERSPSVTVTVNVAGPGPGGAAGGGAAGGGASGGGAAGGGDSAGGAAGGGPVEPDGGPPATVVFVPTCGCASGEGLALLALLGWQRRRRGVGGRPR